MLRPMPSPNGTNRSHRFIVDRSLRGAAYDAAPKLADESALELLEFLRGRLSEEDLAEFCKLAGIDDAVTMDNQGGGPPPFKGMPRRGGTAMDAKTAKSLAERFPHAARIKVTL